MPPADNTKFLLEATRQRSQQARQRAEAAIAKAADTHDRVTVVGIARAALVSRSWLYTQADLVEAITRLQQRRSSPARTGPQPASLDSLQRRLETALDRNKQLRRDNADLTRRLETAYGEIRRLQIAHTPPAGPGRTDHAHIGHR